MIISKDSLLRHPPIKLLPKQVVVFSSITFSVDVCEISYKSLIKELKEFGKHLNPNEELIVPKIFSYTWNIISHLTVLTNTISNHFNISLTEFN